MEEFGPHLNIHVQDRPSLELALEGIERSKESWFCDLPPVLLFNLNRFTFNKEKQCGEKLHNRRGLNVFHACYWWSEMIALKHMVWHYVLKISTSF